jgi:exosortase A-associated hydrolase 1
MRAGDGMNLQERPIVFECEGDRLIGVATLAAPPSTLGVLIVVGGPQYRAGSHRQFVHLARSLARDGYPTFRFDYRGMGDSEGAVRNFEQIEPDIHAAFRAFRVACPSVTRLVAFGLCDAASAVLMAAERIDGLAGMILANPWVRRVETLNAAVVRHYYRERILSTAFWRKLASGRLPLRAAAREFFRRVSDLRTTGNRMGAEAPIDFVDRVRTSWRLPVKKLLLLSGRDLTAQEFEEVRSKDSRWAVDNSLGLLDEVRLPEADHTFSTARWRDDATSASLRFLKQLSRAA